MSLSRIETVPVAPSSEASGRLPARAPQAPSSSTSGPSFARTLARVAGAVDAGEKAIGQTLAMGHDASPLELLTLQTRIYRYAEAVDLSSRLVERSTNAVRTVLQGQ